MAQLGTWVWHGGCPLHSDWHVSAYGMTSHRGDPLVPITSLASSYPSSPLDPQSDSCHGSGYCVTV